MKIIITKKENSDDVYYQIESEPEKILNFDNIKEIAKTVLQNKESVEKVDYEITISDGNLQLYKTTLENIIKSIDDDDDLYNLFKSQSIEKNAQDTDNEDPEKKD